MEKRVQAARLDLNTEGKDARNIVLEAIMGQIINVILILIFTVGMALLISVFALLFDHLTTTYALRFVFSSFVAANFQFGINDSINPVDSR